jgi:2-oxoglutarate ferredoxin oxidoreductase subunit delta
VRVRYNDAVATKDLTQKKLPVFTLKRCKRCGICSHFCPEGAIAELDDGTPVLAKPEACNACRLCEYMCPDWAVYLSPSDEGAPDSKTA